MRVLTCLLIMTMISCSTTNNNNFRSLSQVGNTHSSTHERYQKEIHKKFYDIVQDHGPNYKETIAKIKLGGQGISFLDDSNKNGILSVYSVAGTILPVIGAGFGYLLGAMIFVGSEGSSAYSYMSGLGSILLIPIMTSSMPFKKSMQDEVYMSAFKNREDQEKLTELKVKTVQNTAITFALNSEEVKEFSKALDSEITDSFHAAVASDVAPEPTSILEVMKKHNIAPERTRIYEEFLAAYSPVLEERAKEIVEYGKDTKKLHYTRLKNTFIVLKKHYEISNKDLSRKYEQYINEISLQQNELTGGF